MGVACLLGASLTHNHAIAEPLPLPYRSQGPFIPVFDLNGGAAKGLILSAEEVIRGRPAPITIGNATFFPQVRRAGEKYGGYTRVRGDLQIDRGDLYLGNQPVGETLSALELQAQEHQGQLTDQTQSIQNLNIGLDAASRVVGSQGMQIQESRADIGVNRKAVQELSLDLDEAWREIGSQGEMIQENSSRLVDHEQSLGELTAELDQNRQVVQIQGGQIEMHSGQIMRLESEAENAQRSIGVLNQSVQGLGQTVVQHSAILQSHDQAINALTVDMGHAKQAIGQLNENLSSLGSGMAGATALASALSSVPDISEDAPLTCGVGSGGYSSRYALAMGCAVRLGSRLSLNGAGSYLFNGGVNYGSGSLSNVAGRIGLVYRFASPGGKSPIKAETVGHFQAQLDEARQVNNRMAGELDELKMRLQLLESMARSH